MQQDVLNSKYDERMFNIKNNDEQVKFKKLTSETSEFSQCFENNLNLLEQIANCQNVIKSYCTKASPTQNNVCLFLSFAI